MDESDNQKSRLFKGCTCQKGQDGEVENQNTKAITIDAGDLGCNRVDQSDNQQINKQSFFPNQASDDLSTVEFNDQSVNS